MSKDIIYRQDAIDALKAMAVPRYLDAACEDVWERDRTLDNAIDVMRALPSAQPEIIRCKDCKNSEHWYRDRRRCFLWSEDGVSVFDDGFCNYAERRTDE